MAPAYDRLRPADRNWWELFDAIVEAGDLRGRRVLDVGCGTGRVAHALAGAGARVWGIDPSEEMLAQARGMPLPGGGFRRAKAEELPFKEGWFDGAVLRQVVHLLERPRAFAELARVLRPGGRAVVATFHPDHFRRVWVARLAPKVAELDRARFPTPASLREDLGGAGLRIVRERRIEQEVVLTRAEALERLRGRFISTLLLLDDDEFAEVVDRGERELPARVESTLEWLLVVAERRA